MFINKYENMFVLEYSLLLPVFKQLFMLYSSTM